MRLLKITQCRDPLMWYSGKIGQTVPLLREYEDVYISREDAGYANIVRKEDAVVVFKGELEPNERTIASSIISIIENANLNHLIFTTHDQGVVNGVRKSIIETITKELSI